jgi:hypothetical protein
MLFYELGWWKQWCQRRSQIVSFEFVKIEHETNEMWRYASVNQV